MRVAVAAWTIAALVVAATALPSSRSVVGRPLRSLQVQSVGHVDSEAPAPTPVPESWYGAQRLDHFDGMNLQVRTPTTAACPVTVAVVSVGEEERWCPGAWCSGGARLVAVQSSTL